MQELLWLLLPVAAASGWWAADRRTRREQGAGPSRTTPAYMRGINHVLNEEPDKAIDVFVQLLEVDSETVETHLALGNLFRRRGEVERAIRLHQNLIARPSLSHDERAQALLELGQDYTRAGLLDRAENLFVELKEMGRYRRQALENLLLIYQQEKEWNKCLAACDELEPLTEAHLSLQRSHFHCELALQARERQDDAEANAQLRKALHEYRGCVRALHIQAAMAMDRGEIHDAIRLLKKAGEQVPSYVPETLDDLFECHVRLRDFEGLRHYLEGLRKNRPSIEVDLAMTRLIREQDGSAKAAGYLGEALTQTPSLRGLRELLRQDEQPSPAQSKRILLGLDQHLGNILAQRPQYQCEKCGFEAKTWHWQCPGCRSWSRLKRKTEVEA